ncbi:ScbR family autoregulator-binding transcription factor [Kitasatospora albolonga]
MQDRAEQTVRRIVEAAGVVIDRDGYAGAATPEIQRIAGVSRGGFAHHFPTKADLGDAILARQHTYFRRVAERAESGPPPDLWLQALVDISFDYAYSIIRDPVMRAAVRLSTEPGPYQSAESYATPLSAVTSVLESARRAGEVQPHVDPASVALTLVGCFSGVQIVSLALADREGLDRQVSAMWSVCMPGVARPEVFTRLRLEPPGPGYRADPPGPG